jgi:hypothetical protein
MEAGDIAGDAQFEGQGLEGMGFIERIAEKAFRARR